MKLRRGMKIRNKTYRYIYTLEKKTRNGWQITNEKGNSHHLNERLIQKAFEEVR